MGKGIDFPSTQWAMSTFASGGGGAGVEVTVMGFYMLNVKSQVIYPGRFISVGIGGGAGGFVERVFPVHHGPFLVRASH